MSVASMLQSPPVEVEMILLATNNCLHAEVPVLMIQLCNCNCETISMLALVPGKPQAAMGAVPLCAALVSAPGIEDGLVMVTGD